MWELPPSGWYKFHFDGLIHGDRDGAGFVVRSNNGASIEVDSFSVTILLMSKTKKKDLWEALVWALDVRIVLERDT